jgi:stage V sporulation protein AD
MKEWFDTILEDNTFGEKTWEKSESKMLKGAMMTALQKSGKSKSDIDALISGDLLNQLMSSSFMARDLQIPFIGLYGACSTMAESLIMSSVLIDGGYAGNVIAGASSHFCTAERQFRTPIEHGNQRPPSAQWTATAAGAMVISCDDKRADISEVSYAITEANKVNPELRPAKQIVVTHGTVGKVIDTGMKDANQMGAAMAPAAVDTILNHLEDTGRELSFYDLILTGDLGFIGKEIAKDLLSDAGLRPEVLDNVYDDCGSMMFLKEQDVHGGASGCGCSASIFSSYVYKKMITGQVKNALLVSTGALLSTISPFQGESIPGIAHAVALKGQEAVFPYIGT